MEVIFTKLIDLPNIRPKQHGSLISVFTICHRRRPSHDYYIFVLSPISQKVTVTCIQGRQSILDGFTRAFAPFFSPPFFFPNHIVREEEALVDLWAGCHVFRQA